MVLYPLNRMRGSAQLRSGWKVLSAHILEGRRNKMKVLPTLVVMSVVIAGVGGYPAFSVATVDLTTPLSSG